MANTVITSTTNSIKVQFNDDAQLTGMNKGVWNKSAIKHFSLHSNHISAETQDEVGRWHMTHESNSSGYLLIDTVDGVAPSSLSDLYDKLAALIA